MAKDIKVLRKKIKSFDSTLHLTGAMGLVASSKIRKATDAMLEGRKYLGAIQGVVDDLKKCPDCKKCVYFGEGVKASEESSDKPRTKLIVIAGDRGLCGGYNANVFRLVRDMDEDVDVIPIGKRAYDRYTTDLSETDDDYAENNVFESSEYYSYESAMKLAQECCKDFAEGKIDKVGIVYNEYVSIMTQTPSVKWVLPLTRPEKGEIATGVYEPDPMELLNNIVPQYVAGVLYALVKESFACEVAARRMAMDSAKKNATEMIDNLQLEYNRVRQGKITQEITEIVAGAGK
ncbi:MAG: ATP synthase F1 subunit gamma [Saccharofermentans sp.]|nr:ATP synthase F1 subunit gamma [Saccharofermentans sp.]